MNKLFTKEQIRAATSKLNSVLRDDDVDNGILFQPFVNTTITQDFSRKSLKRINVTGSNFLNCQFCSAAASGSRFFNVIFQNTDFSGSNFQYCYFNGVQFVDASVIKGANFSHSVFIECSFSNISIVESTLYDCHFEKCTFDKSIIRSNTLENSTISNCTIQEIDLAHVNLEYIKLDSVHMNNVILPPYQIPYIIGAPCYLQESNEKIYIYTDSGQITIKEYCRLYNELAAYFFSLKCYFPLANLLIANDKHIEAFEVIQHGIEEACDYFDFRMIKHYCRLACSNNSFTTEQLKTLYSLVTNLSYNKDWDVNILHSYMLNIGEIKEILLNNSVNKQCVDFLIKTTIDKDDLPSINALYNFIDLIIKEICSSAHVFSVELRHNSPYELYLTCIDMLPNVLLLISIMYSIFTTGNKSIEFFKNIEDTIHLHHTNRLHKYELEEKKIEIEIKKEELKRLKSAIKTYDTTSVVELEHALKCNSVELAKKITPEYLHYKISNFPE